MSVESELRCPLDADLKVIRDAIRAFGERAGLCEERLRDLVMSVHEAVTNVHDHGGGAGTVVARCYEDCVVVEVIDVAGKLTVEHVAAARVDPAASRGFGLWAIVQLCDAVSVDQIGGGSRLSLYVDRWPPIAPGHARS